METADNCRRAAFEAVADVEPPRLHDLVETILEDASMVPGALTIESAACATSESGSVRERADRDGGADHTGEQENIRTHAAGVQLIYEGLRLTRTLAHEEPWSSATDDTARTSEADLEILAADILVARGFYLLARTKAADKAVQTVRAFGRDQNHRVGDQPVTGSGDAGDPREAVGFDARTADGETNLERDVLELAVLTGAAAVGERPSPRLLALADDLARTVGPSFPPTEECLPDGDLETRPSDATLEDGTTDRATSATDH